MGNKDSKNDLEFSDEELLDLERGRENRSRFSPDGRPRQRTHRKALRIPADIVPRKAGDRAADDGAGPAVARSTRAAPPASLLWPADPGTAPAKVEAEDAPTEPQLVPPVKPPASARETQPMDAVQDEEPAPPPPPPEAVRALEPEEAVTEVEEVSDATDLAELAETESPAGPGTGEVWSSTGGLADAATEPALQLDAGVDQSPEASSEIPGAAVQKAVQIALEAAASAPPQALAKKEFDVDQPTPGASQAFEELSARSLQSGLAEVVDADQERANRVSILLSALRSAAGAESAQAEPGAAAPDAAATEGLERVPSGEVASAEEFADAAPEEAPWVGETAPLAAEPGAAPPESAEPSAAGQPAAGSSASAPAETAAAPDMEELSGEELEEEVAAAADAGVQPPPIPEAPASPFEGEAEEPPAVVEEVKVPLVETPVDDDAIMTSAPPDLPPNPPPAPAAPTANAGVDESAEPAAPEEIESAAVEEAVEEVSEEPPRPTAPPIPQSAAKPTPAAAQTRGRKRKRAWFEEIFDEDWLRTLRPRTAEQTRKEVQFLEESLQPSRESQILDVGCGDGRHALELAARGYQVTGYDLSLPLLIRAADEAQRRDLHVNFVHGDFRELSFGDQFDAVYCLFTTFGYFDDDTNRKMIQAIANALRVGGRVLLDVVNRDYAIRDLPARIWWEGTGCVILEEVDFNYFTSRIISKRSVVFEDGRHLEQEISVRSYSLHELGKIMHHAGFRVLEVSGHLAHRTRFFGNSSRSLVLLAEKRAANE